MSLNLSVRIAPLQLAMLIVIPAENTLQNFRCTVLAHFLYSVRHNVNYTAFQQSHPQIATAANIATNWVVGEGETLSAVVDRLIAQGHVSTEVLGGLNCRIISAGAELSGESDTPLSELGVRDGQQMHAIVSSAPSGNVHANTSANISEEARRHLVTLSQQVRSLWHHRRQQEQPTGDQVPVRLAGDVVNEQLPAASWLRAAQQEAEWHGAAGVTLGFFLSVLSFALLWPGLSCSVRLRVGVCLGFLLNLFFALISTAHYESAFA